MFSDADLLRIASRLPLLRFFGTPVRQQLLARSDIVALASGQALYEAGSAPEALYVVVSGRLRAEYEQAEQLRGWREIGRGESVGGLSILSMRPHRARLLAVRDSRLLRIPAPAFLDAFDAEPAAARRVLQRWLQRLFERQAEQRARWGIGSLRTVAVVGGHDGAPVEAVARGLAQALSQDNLCLRLDREQALRRLGGEIGREVGADEPALALWLNEMEQRHRHLVLQGGCQMDAWTMRCIRQADRVLLVCDSGAPLIPGPVLRRLGETGSLAEVEIAATGRADGQPAAWRELAGAVMIHRLRECSGAEFERLSRMLGGRALGLALGGGGARGFAHVGLLEAMEKLGLVADIVYGTSMGAFIGALVARGHDARAVREAAVDTWVRRKLLNDYTVPRVSLIRARKARRHLERLFGSARIEDLPLHFGCVSTNLNKGTAVVHDTGLIAHWVGASMSVPGIAPPVVYRGELLVDGGLVAPVPVEQVVDLARGPVVASDVTAEENFRGLPDDARPEQLQRSAAEVRTEVEQVNIFQILFRAATLTSPEEYVRRQRLADCYLRMPVAGIGMFHWDKAETVIDAAREVALRRLEAFLQRQRRQAA